MDLLFKREQKTGWIRRRVNFKLWAKAEFTDEEQALITKYRMDRAMLVPVPTPGLLRTAIIVALITFPIAYLLWVFVIWPLTYLRISFYVQLAGCAMASLFVAFAYYHQKNWPAKKHISKASTGISGRSLKAPNIGAAQTSARLSLCHQKKPRTSSCLVRSSRCPCISDSAYMPF